MASAPATSAGAQATDHTMATVSGTSDGAIGAAVPFSLHYVAGEVTSAAMLIGAWAQALTPVVTLIATLLAITWYVIMMYESQTVTRILKARRQLEQNAQDARNKVLTVAKDTATQLQTVAKGTAQQLQTVADDAASQLKKDIP